MAATCQSVRVLLGSGASWPRGDKSVKALTELVLGGQGYIQYSDGRYVRMPPNPGLASPEETVVPLTSFLAGLRSLVWPYFEERVDREPNYEDLFYLVRRMANEASGELDDALVRFARERLEDSFRAFRNDYLRSTRVTPRSVPELLEEVANYIGCVIATELDDVPSSIAHLDWVDDGLRDRHNSIRSLLTLNHDRILEAFLRDRGFRFNDGFTETSQGGVAFWNPVSVSPRCGHLCLLKLHGSLGWYTIRPDDRPDRYGERYARLDPGVDPYHVPGPDGRWMATARYPLILMGTFNKIVDYTKGIFLDLYASLREHLRDTDAVVVVGYGFGDKGINNQIVEWIYNDGKRRIVVIHPDPDTLFGNARGAIANKVAAWKGTGILREIQKPMETVRWEEVRSAIET